MDEAEKYKQRLEAIAEKRRLLEEQDKAKREMEDERIRLQQLKRKSLRDQWLMEGPPPSPNSLDSPRSPLWVGQTQEMEKHIEMLESQTQQLAETEEKLTEEMQDDQTTTVEVKETPIERVQNAVHNGETETESGVEIHAVIVTNGAAEREQDIVTSEDVLQTSNGLSEEIKSGQVVYLNNKNIASGDDEEEEGTIVIRAECVMITDEGEDTAEDNAKENSLETATLISEESQKTVTESEQMVATNGNAGLSECTIIPNGLGDDHLEGVTAVQQQSPTADVAEVAAVAAVPVYSELQPSITTIQAEDESKTVKEDSIEVTSKPKDNIKVEFQEVPLTPGEQESLLSQVKPQIPVTEKGRTSDETEMPNRADQAETKMPKRKTCQCCSVM